MPITTLIAKKIPSLTCPSGVLKIDHRDGRCRGLTLEVRASGGKTWYLRYRDIHGSQRQYRMGVYEDLSLDQARKRADELRGQIALGHDPCEAKATLRQVPTLAQFVTDRYLPYIKGYKRSWETDVSLLKNHVLPAMGAQYMDSIKKTDVVALHHGRRDGGAAPGSANRLLIIVRYMFNLAIRWEIPGVTKNPSAGVPLFEENNKLERYLTKEEAQRLNEALLESQNQQLRFIVPGLILTGARKRELLDAQWADFDLKQRSWRIPISKLGKARHVPLSDAMLQLLTTVRESQSRWPSAMLPCPWVFANPDTGKPFVSIFCSWDTARKKAGLPDVRIHDLRHSFASCLVNAGRSIYEVQRLLGHTQIKTTLRYAHLSKDTLIAASNTVLDSLGSAFMPPVPANEVTTTLLAA